MPILSRTPLQPKHPLRPRRPYAALPLLWAALVLVLTLTPAADMPITPVWELLSFDTAAHAGVFAVLAGLSRFSLRRQSRWPRLARHTGAAALLASILFGGLIEVLQHYMHLGRHGDWTDLLSDAIGAALAVGVATLWASRRRKLRQVPVASLLLLVAMLAAIGAPAQDIPRARRTIEKLAASDLHGRGYVNDGDKKAAAYLRQRLKGLKLEPLAPNYTQPFTLDVNTFPGVVALHLSHNPFPGLGPAKRLRPGTDFIVSATSGSGFLSKTRRLLYLDSTIVNDPIRVRAFLLESQQPCTIALLDRYTQHPDRLPAKIAGRIDSASAVLRVVPKLTASLATSQVPGQMQLEVLSQPLLNTSLADNSLHAYGVEVRVDAQLRRDYPTQNLAAIIRGTAQPDSFLVISAHYDHLGMMGRKTYFPGANDNASGVALLLELAAHYARPENCPAYSVVFLLFGAEEAGLLGSRYFVAHPLVPLKSIKFLVNLDLLGTGEQGATVVNGRVFEAPYRRLLALNEAHHYLPALGARGRAANSDHFPFSEAGVPAFFIYTRGGSAAYHDVNDRPAALSLAGFAGAFGLVRDFLGELGAAPATKK